MTGEWQEIAEFINRVGFPIGVVVWMLWERHVMFKELKEEFFKLRQAIRENMQ